MYDTDFSITSKYTYTFKFKFITYVRTDERTSGFYLCTYFRFRTDSYKWITFTMVTPLNRFRAAALLLVTTSSFSHAFVPLHRHCLTNKSVFGKSNNRNEDGPTILSVVNGDDEQQGSVDNRLVYKKYMKNFLEVSASATVLSALFTNGKCAEAASAPIAPMKQLSFKDQGEEALKSLKKERSKARMKEAMAHRLKCEDIESEKGPAARKLYEDKYAANQQKEAELKKKRIQNVKKNLLINDGICPFVDPEGIRQIYLLEEGINLEKVPGTPVFVEMTKTKRDKNGKHATYRQEQRFIIKCIAEDLRARDIDPLQYFEENKEKTKAIIDMYPAKVNRMYQQYKKRVEESGTLSGLPKKEPFVEQEVSDDSRVEEPVSKADAKRAAKLAAAKKKAEQKALAAKKKAEEKALAAEKKAAEKAQKAAAKAEAKAAKEAAKIEAASKAALLAQQLNTELVDTEENNSSDEVFVDETESEVSNEVAVEEVSTSVVDNKDKSKISSQIVPVVAIVGVTGGAGYAFKVTKDKAAEAEAERQRQFKLIMGMNDDDEEEDDDDELALDDSSYEPAASKSTDAPKPPKIDSTPVEKAPKIKKKRRGGLGSVFNKKTNSRETDISVLLEPGAEASSFATLLAKLLNFGAPGRFPVVDSLEIDAVPKGFTFELEQAKQLLKSSREDCSLTDEVSAETFACVVNCMLIDIVDLASSTLKGKDDKMTVNALNVVMDFMDHAASLFDAVAEGVTITPVTYGGNLGKKQLEQMFSVYSSAMMTMLGTESGSAVTQDRVDTLQQVFNINDKRAEGLIQKSMMKNLMKMMKDGPEGGGMEGLSEMLGSMGGEGGEFPGLEGLAGMGGDEELSPEELKQSVSMMKELVDSGSVSKEELSMVRQQFKEVYGTDIKEMIEAADQDGAGDDLGAEGKELLDLFKTILKDD